MIWTHAFANAAMAAFAYWNPWAYLGYVVTMVAGEAWLLGRKFQWPWRESLRKSLLANLASAGLGTVCCSVFPSGLLILLGPGWSKDPNPTLGLLLTLVIGGLISSIVEMPIWMKGEPRKKPGPVWLVHLLLIPIGVIVFNLPARPYPYAEWEVNSRRSSTAATITEKWVEMALGEGKFPQVRGVEDIARGVGETRFSGFGAQDLDNFFVVRYGRFAFGPDRGRPWEVNTSLSGQKFQPQWEDVEKPKWVWVARTPTGAPRELTVWLDLNTGLTAIRRSGESPELPSHRIGSAP